MQHKTSEKDLNQIEISNLPDKMFKKCSYKCSSNMEEEWIHTVRTSTKR